MVTTDRNLMVIACREPYSFKRMMNRLFLLLCLAVCFAFSQVFGETMRIAVEEVTAEKDDEYICQSHLLTDDNLYITHFKPDMNRKLVHHMLLYVCRSALPGVQRNCYSPCAYGSESRIIYAWANEAPELHLPEDVSFKVGSASGWNNIVIQVHYKDHFEDQNVKDSSGVVLSYQADKTKYTAGIYLFASAKFLIKPGKSDVRAMMECTMKIDDPFYIFAVRTHAHSHGRAIGVFAKNGSNWKTIVERSPQRAQAFYPLPTPFKVTDGHDLAARCVFDASNEKKAIHMGSTRNDEMCNAYLMFYTKDESFTFDVCTIPNPHLDLPEPDATEVAFKGDGHQHHHSSGMASSPEAHASMSKAHMANKPEWKFQVTLDTDYAELTSADQFPAIGQVGGVSKDSFGNLFVFHRADREWTPFTFDSSHRYSHKTSGPIRDNTILVIAPNGTVIDRFGSDLFYLPHGITVCQSSNSIWLTDVALHQVFRFGYDAVMNRADKSSFNIEPQVFGEEFEPGSDENHFCQPAAVATLKDGTAVVADGYCNSRLLAMSKSGKVKKSVELESDGRKAHVVHSVVYDSVTNEIFAADRENSRVFSVNANSFEIGVVISTDEHVESSKLYALGIYTPAGCSSVIVGMNQSDTENGDHAAFFYIDPKENKLVDVEPVPNEADRSHTIVVDSANNWIYVGQIHQKMHENQLMRFRTQFVGTCDKSSPSGSSSSETVINNFMHKNEMLLQWVKKSVRTPSSFVGLLVFSLTACVVIMIAVVVGRMCRKRGTPNMRRPPRGSANRDYAAQYSLLVGDAATKRGGKRGAFEDFTSDDDDDTMMDRRLVSKPPGGGAKSRYSGFPPANGSPTRAVDAGDKIV